MKRTSVHSVVNKAISVKRPPIDTSKMEVYDMCNMFHDGSTTFDERKALFTEISKRDSDLARNTVTDLCRNIEHTGSKDLLNFACFLIDNGGLDIFMKLECAMALDNSSFTNSLDYFAVILKYYRDSPKNERPSIAIYVDVIKYLLSACLKEDSPLLLGLRESVEWLIKDSELSPDFLYKSIIGIQRDTSRQARK